MAQSVSISSAPQDAWTISSAPQDAWTPDGDSLKTKEEIQLELQRLREELEDVKAELDSKKSGELSLEEERDFESRITNIETHIEDLESQLAALNAGDEWDLGGFGADSSGDEWEKPESSSGEFDDWSSLQMDFFRKYPAAFEWPFPMATAFANSFIRYNRVDGFYIGLSKSKRLNWHSKKRIVSTFSLGYAFASHRGRYSAGLYFPFYYKDHIFEVGGEGHLLTDSRDQWMIEDGENSLMAFFAKEDFMDYFQRGGFSAGGSWYYRSPQEVMYRVSVQYIHDTYKEAGKETNWSLFGGDKTFRVNPLANNIAYFRQVAGNINSIVVGAGFTSISGDSRDEGWRGTVTYESAGGTAKGDFEFNQLVADLRRYQPIGEFLQFNARARLGGSEGTVPFQRMFDLGGIGTVPGYRFKHFSGTHLGLINTEFIVKSKIARISDGWFKRITESFNLIFTFDAGMVSMDQGLNPAVDGRGLYISAPAPESIFDGISDLMDLTWKSSAGIAVGGSDGSYRIGVAWPLNGPDKKPELVIRLASPF